MEKTNLEIIEEDAVEINTPEFKEYEIAGIVFPGLGITYLDAEIGCPIVLVPKDKMSVQLKNILTAYAMDYYIAGQGCMQFDRNILSDTLLRVKVFLFNLCSLQFIDMNAEDGVWRLI